jgi:NAD(P)-dependent dehydrogenase (short-subunit alcohol dehydrogenase family)
MSGIINYRGFDLKDTPSLEGKVCVITGGQAGIGKEMVAQLLIHGIKKVVVLSRSAEKFHEAEQYWKEKHNLTEEDLAERVSFMSLDLIDITKVKAVADKLREELGRLDILIENAGQLKVETCYGTDLTME